MKKCCRFSPKSTFSSCYILTHPVSYLQYNYVTWKNSGSGGFPVIRVNVMRMLYSAGIKKGNLALIIIIIIIVFINQYSKHTSEFTWNYKNKYYNNSLFYVNYLHQ